jgi:anaerobic magnesium-protoporphyrin IX monomethyl ester cyclase
LTLSPDPVILVAFGEEENLGVGYLISVLNNAGIEARIIDFRYDNDEILAGIRRHNPVAVGFSVIFEVYIDAFARLIRYLREGGIDCHFTAGGYFASLYPEELFRLIPELDSIVRFEGEYTFLDLINSLIAGKDWRRIKSLAFRENGRITRTPLRSLEKDLDTFPFPVRKSPVEYVPGRIYCTIIAGRGCNYNCTFCNTRQFYRQPGGPLRRVRNPEMVVSEMHQLYTEKRCTVFLFQDDDSPVKTAGGNRWMKSFCNELERKGLHNKVIWKINCRPDEIERDTFLLMKQHGLFQVFIGLEDGTDEGLSRLNKRMKAATSLQGIEILNSLDIGYDYGMMLFQPESSFKSLSENLKFIETISSEGTAPMAFLKLMPYFGTQVEKELREQGRLKGNPGSLDYNFRSESLDTCWLTISECFADWQWGREGVVNLAKWVRNYIAVLQYFGDSYTLPDKYRGIYRDIVAKSNLYLGETMTGIFNYYESGDYMRNGQQYKEKIRINSGTRHQYFSRILLETLRSMQAEA